MTKKKLKKVVLDHFLAYEVVKERRTILEAKKRNLNHEMENFAALKVQISWRAKKTLSRTRLMVRLHRK